MASVFPSTSILFACSFQFEEMRKDFSYTVGIPLASNGKSLAFHWPLKFQWWNTSEFSTGKLVKYHWYSIGMTGKITGIPLTSYGYTCGKPVLFSGILMVLQWVIFNRGFFMHEQPFIAPNKSILLLS